MEFTHSTFVWHFSHSVIENRIQVWTFENFHLSNLKHPPGVAISGRLISILLRPYPIRLKFGLVGYIRRDLLWNKCSTSACSNKLTRQKPARWTHLSLRRHLHPFQTCVTNLSLSLSPFLKVGKMFWKDFSVWSSLCCKIRCLAN